MSVSSHAQQRLSARIVHLLSEIVPNQAHLLFMSSLEKITTSTSLGSRSICSRSGKGVNGRSVCTGAVFPLMSRRCLSFEEAVYGAPVSLQSAHHKSSV